MQLDDSGRCEKPEDGWFKATGSLLTAIDKKKVEPDSRRLLTEGELERLTEEFVVEYAYNFNTIEGGGGICLPCVRWTWFCVN